MNHYKITLSNLKYRLAGMSKWLDEPTLMNKIDSDYMSINQFHKKVGNYLLEEAFDGKTKYDYWNPAIGQLRTTSFGPNVADAIKSIESWLTNNLTRDLNVDDLKVTSKFNNDELVFDLETSVDLNHKSRQDKITKILTKVTTHFTGCNLHFLVSPIELTVFFGRYTSKDAGNFSYADNSNFENYCRDFNIIEISRDFGDGTAAIMFTAYKFE